MYRVIVFISRRSQLTPPRAARLLVFESLIDDLKSLLLYINFNIFRGAGELGRTSDPDSFAYTALGDMLVMAVAWWLVRCCC